MSDHDDKLTFTSQQRYFTQRIVFKQRFILDGFEFVRHNDNGTSQAIYTCLKKPYAILRYNHTSLLHSINYANFDLQFNFDFEMEIDEDDFETKYPTDNLISSYFGVEGVLDSFMATIDVNAPAMREVFNFQRNVNLGGQALPIRDYLALLKGKFVKTDVYKSQINPSDIVDIKAENIEQIDASLKARYPKEIYDIFNVQLLEFRRLMQIYFERIANGKSTPIGI